MKRFVLCVVFCLLFASKALGACQTVYMPDLNGPEGVVTDRIPRGYPVPPTDGLPFYPFQAAYETSGRFYITQEVGTKPFREWHNVKSVSLVWWNSWVYVGEDTLKNQYFQDALGIWRPWKDEVQIIAYTTLPNTAPVGVEATWAYYEDFRVDVPVKPMNLSTPMLLGEHWNLGWFAPHGVRYGVAQVRVMVCQ